MSPPARGTPRWVLDTNVVLSALIRPGGVSGRLRLAWQAALCVPLVSRATAAELIRVLAYPRFKLTPDEQHDLLADYLPWTEAFRIPESPPRTPPCRDPHDLPFLQLALAAKADALVTGDADLHVLAPLRGLAILTPAQAVERLSS
ncbi:putative toxin-antitoxin system toxin component, PIN family [Fulvimonas sp. R45]|uniref:putative toxin-antitoxin system toxin component, PIN family n=1 Tax=Fulvimonas sp. R45 TaxID=3045937 RepID=UPI00265FB7BD|nr:putative toxin-antitoxin system toxin component, PIN family [Fulvimonas sp. R45]MDO1528570.1 putative toxin-antitoxin system toxin component, PIN family [Fulvimonas sp. R45]